MKTKNSDYNWLSIDAVNSNAIRTYKQLRSYESHKVLTSKLLSIKYYASKTEYWSPWLDFEVETIEFIYDDKP
jgi:hypothetical protein